MLDAGEDVFVVSRLAGYAQVQTTPLHDRRGAKAEQAAIQRFAVPYMALRPCVGIEEGSKRSTSGAFVGRRR
jgi:hypothetical protein